MAQTTRPNRLFLLCAFLTESSVNVGTDVLSLNEGGPWLHVFLCELKNASCMATLIEETFC